jgi:hypothetical protein
LGMLGGFMLFSLELQKALVNAKVSGALRAHLRTHDDLRGVSQLIPDNCV